MTELIDPFYNAYAAITTPTYEGASLTYKAERYNLHSGEHDQLAACELATLQMRTADLIRNNGYAKTALDKYVTSLGAINVNWNDAKGKKNTQMQDLWDEFAANPNLDGYGTLANTQSIWHSSMFKSGSAFTQFMIKRTDNTNKVPLKLKTIPTQLHDITYSGLGLTDKSLVTNYGISFRDTKPEIYYFRKAVLEQNWYNYSGGNLPTAIPANELLHMFIREDPGQWIGIPALASVLIPLYELDELTDATIAKQKAAQAIAWIVENTNPLAMTPTGSPITVKDKDNKDKIVFKATGGNTQYLNKGEKINFYQSTDIGANLPVLIKSELQRISSAIGIPYHSLTGDTSGLDFSSLRGIAIELRNRLEYIHHFYTIPLGLNPLTSYFANLAKLYGKKVTNATPVYQLPRWLGIDDLKDCQADLLEVQSGFATLQSKLDERHTSFEEIVADRERIKEVGLDNLLNPNGASTNQSTNIQANSNSTGN
jgi:lambda family phage portal protein